MKSGNNPWSFIPTLYFAEGLPYVLVNNLSVAMFKSLGVSNELIGLTSLLYIPWAIKLFWAPAVDGNSTKRNWLLTTQILLAVCFFAVAAIMFSTNIYILSFIIFAVIAFISATHDISIDGFYLHTLDKKDQAFFTGIRNTFYRFSVIFGSGILVTLAGVMSEKTGIIESGWSISFGFSAVIFVLFFVWHKIILPYPETDKSAKGNNTGKAFGEAFKEYFSRKGIIIILAYILLYRLGEGLIIKMAQPFLMDGFESGGMNISVSSVGFYYGTVGVSALVIGGILGGILIKKYSLKKLIFPMALFMNLPNILYMFLAFYRPGDIIQINLSFISSGWIIDFNYIVQLCIVFEQFGYGLGFTAFMVYLLYISQGKYKTTHYAISTGIMAVGMMLPGLVSGWLQAAVGYTWLFGISFLATIPGMIIIFFLPVADHTIEKT